MAARLGALVLIPSAAILEGVHCIVDAIQWRGNGHDYYKINHLSDSDFRRLARVVRVWLWLCGVKSK